MVDLRGKKGVVKAHPDFKDQKYKVGHGNLKPQNEMKTDFKQKRIVLAKQSGITEQSSDPQIDLFAKCRHYAGKRRVEAFRELSSCRSEISPGLRANYLSVVCQGIVDDEKEVRKLAGNFFQEISASSPSSSASEALGLSLRAALSHVHSEIRGDALRLASSVNLSFLPEISAIEISRSLVERRLSTEISSLLLKVVREVFTQRDVSSNQWRLSQLKRFSLETPKISFLNSLVTKLAVPDDLKSTLLRLGVEFPAEPTPEELAKKKRKLEEVSDLKSSSSGRTFGVGGRAFAALMESDVEEYDD